jgi:hypothetical protein
LKLGKPLFPVMRNTVALERIIMETTRDLDNPSALDITQAQYKQDDTECPKDDEV